jgi:hypothetical protein
VAGHPDRTAWAVGDTTVGSLQMARPRKQLSLLMTRPRKQLSLLMTRPCKQVSLLMTRPCKQVSLLMTRPCKQVSLTVGVMPTVVLVAGLVSSELLRILVLRARPCTQVLLLIARPCQQVLLTLSSASEHREPPWCEHDAGVPAAAWPGEDVDVRARRGSAQHSPRRHGPPGSPSAR